MNKYPSIEQFKNFKNEVTKICKYDEQITIIGTIKLHGTHGDIIKRDDKIIFQSRNNILNENFDNMDFYKDMKQKSIQKLFDKIENNSNFKILIQNEEHDQDLKDIMISGEYCGQKIQRGVALEQFKKRIFVIFDIKIGNTWVNMNLYKDVFLEEEDIYNIYNYSTWSININVKDIDNPELQNRLYRITEEVEKECPFSKAFGVSGIGEGLVWRCKQYPTSRLWFKTKGEIHTISKVKTLKPISEEQKIKLQNINNFCNAVLTHERKRQGIDYLIENTGGKVDFSDQKNKKILIPMYVKWINDDIFKEEMNEIKEYSINIKELQKNISKEAVRYINSYLNGLSN